jgi:hypothetical protein
MRAPKYITFLAFLLMGISGASQDTESQRPRAATPVIPKNVGRCGDCDAGSPTSESRRIPQARFCRLLLPHTRSAHL